MDAEFDSDELLEGLLRKLRSGAERRRNFESETYEDDGIDATGEWMCPACGVFLSEERSRCYRCGGERW
jgi:hypothetical protein